MTLPKLRLVYREATTHRHFIPLTPHGLLAHIFSDAKARSTCTPGDSAYVCLCCCTGAAAVNKRGSLFTEMSSRRCPLRGYTNGGTTPGTQHRDYVGDVARLGVREGKLDQACSSVCAKFLVCYAFLANIYACRHLLLEDKEMNRDGDQHLRATSRCNEP